MNAEQIVFSLLLPTAISIGAAVINNQRLKRLEFNYDYRKYILDKRKEAYTKIETILNGFQNVHLDDGQILQRFYDLPVDGSKSQVNPLAVFNDTIVVDATRSTMWMSTNMTAILEYLNFLFVNQMKQLKEKGMKHTALTEIGIRDNSHLICIHAVLFDTYLEDLMLLDDIDVFRKMKQRETPERVKQARKFIASEIKKKQSIIDVKPSHS